MKIAVVKEHEAHEHRVALTPEGVKKLAGAGFEIFIQAGAGEKAGFADEEYKAVGAVVTSDTDNLFKDAKITMRVAAPDAQDVQYLHPHTVLIGSLKPHVSTDLCKELKSAKITSFSLDLIPRITRAQSMDVLSSQSNLSGYRAVVEGAQMLPRAFPMMMTPSGTIPPARVLILGAGVAGLQAIATAKRLGAIVSAFDVRAAAKEQVESLGASFVSVDFEETGDGSGGYAKEMSEAYKQAQRAKLMEVLKTQDLVISTAQIPFKPAPTLLDKEMVEVMKATSLVIDLAIESGGNCTLSKSEKVVDHKGVKIYAPRNMPSHIAYDASQMLSRNAVNFINNLIKDGNINWDDEIVKGTCLTHEGKITHPLFAEEK